MLKQVLVLFLLAKLALGAEPNLLLNYLKAEIINYENPIMGENSITINPHPKENSLTMNFEFKEVVPEDALVKMTIDKGNGIPLKLKMKLCDTFHDRIVGKDFYKRMIPEDKAPKECPIQPASLTIPDYSLKKGTIPPFFFQDGIVKLTSQITGADEAPYFTLNVDMEVSHDSLIGK